MGNESSQLMEEAANAEDETVVPSSPIGNNMSNDVFDKIAGSQAQEEKSRRKSQLVESMLLNNEVNNPEHDDEKAISKKERRKTRHSNEDEHMSKSKKRKHKNSDDLEVVVGTQEQVETADAEPVTEQPAPSAPVKESSSQSTKHKHKHRKASTAEVHATQEADGAAQEWPAPSAPVEEPSSQSKKRKHKKSSQREVASSQEVAEYTDELGSQLAQKQPVEPVNTSASQTAQKKRAKKSKAADVKVVSEGHEDTVAANVSGQDAQGFPLNSTPFPARTPAEQTPTTTTGRRKRRLDVEDAADTPTKKNRKNMNAKRPEDKKPRKTRKTELSDASNEKTPVIPIPKERAGFAKVINNSEWDLVAKEMKTHREMHNLSELEQIRLIHGSIRKNTQGYELFDMICDVLPGDRRRWGIIKAIRRKYHDFERRGEWLPEEDLELENLIKQHGKRWSVIAELMCRMPEDIRDRYRSKVACGPQQRLGKWSFAETLQFKIIVQKCQEDALRKVREQALALPEKQRAALEDNPAVIRFIDWERVSTEMARARSVDQCRRKWAVLYKKGESGNEKWMAKLKRKKRYLAEASSMDLDDKLELLRALKSTGIQDEDNIPWKDIGGANIKANYKRSSRKLAWEWMKFTVRSKKALSLQYTLTRLINELESCNGDDPTKAAFEDYGERLDYRQDIEKLQHTKKQPAERTKHSAVKVAAMSLREKLRLLNALKDSRIPREEDADWNGILHDERSLSIACKKKAWRLLKTTVETAPAKRRVKEEESLLTEDEEAGPATVVKLGFQDIINVLIKRLESWQGKDQSKELFTAEAEALGLEAKVKDLEKRKDNTEG